MMIRLSAYVYNLIISHHELTGVGNLGSEDKFRPGAFQGESPVQRKSKYEGAGNSYMVGELCV